MKLFKGFLAVLIFWPVLLLLVFLALVDVSVESGQALRRGIKRPPTHY